MDYIYFTGDYVTYCNGLAGDDAGGASALTEVVGVVNDQMSTISSQLTEWAGSSGDAYQEVSQMLLTQFTGIQENINAALTPACEAMGELKGKLDAFKEQDALTVEKKKAYEELRDNPVKKKEWTEKDSNGNDVKKDNSDEVQFIN